MQSYKYRKYKVHAYFKDNFGSLYKTIQVHVASRRTTQKGFPHIKYLVAYKTG